MRSIPRITWRHVALLVVVFATGILLGANELLPVHVRFPGMIVLVALGIWLLFSPAGGHAPPRPHS